MRQDDPLGPSPLRRLRAAPALFVLCLAATTQGAKPPAKPPVDAFAALPAISRPALSPDGRHLALLRPIEGRYRPVVLALGENGEPLRRIRLDPGSGIVDIVDVEWSGSERLLIEALGNRPFQQLPDNRLLVYALERRELYPLVRPPRAGGHSLRAQRESERRRLSVRLIDPLPFVPDKALALVRGPETGGAQVWRIDLDSRSWRTVIDEARGYLSFKADPDGHVRLAKRAPRGQMEILYRAQPDGSWRRIDGIDLSGGESLAGLGERGDALWVLSPAGGSGRILYRLDPETGERSEPLFGPTKRDVIAPLVAEQPDRRRLVGYRAAGHFRRDVYLAPDWAERQKQIDARLPESVNRIVTSNTAASRHVVVAEAAGQPARYFLYDEPSDALHALGSTHPELAGTTLPAKRPVRYRARDGTAIPAYLTLPAGGERPFPAVLLVHGGPQSRVHQDFDYWVQFMASRGYAVLEPNFRGSSGYGAGWERAGRREWGGLMQRDVTDGARWLARTGIAEPERLCIMGGSYGGYAALMGAAQTPDLYACAIAVNAVSDLRRMVRDDRRAYPGAPWTRFVGLGQGTDEEARLARGSPLLLADRIAAPVLLVHARDDMRVPVAHSEEMASALEKAGARVRLVRLSGGGHPIMDAGARRRLLVAVERFLAETLGREQTAAADAP